MMGMWRQLNEMHDSDKKGYDDFIQKQSEEWQAAEKKKQEEREKKRIITPTPLCTIKILVSKIVVQKNE